MNKEVIKKLIVEYQEMVKDVKLTPRQQQLSSAFNYVLVGLRRSGKSFLLYQHVQKLLQEGTKIEEILYFNFEDDRLDGITLADLDTIKTCYEELYSYRPLFFLDEIQNVEGWEHFARRLADHGYRVYITGSNSTMLSMEISGTLGGRFMIEKVFPYSLEEYLTASGISLSSTWQYSQQRNEVVRVFQEYFYYGGLPELVSIDVNLRRAWLNNLYNKIFFGDILARFSIRNNLALKVIIRKLAEAVKHPISFNRLANIVSSTGIRAKSETVADYLDHAHDSCLIFSLENYAAKIAEKMSNKKYYFVDNGLLNLFLLDPETSLLENMVAIQLFKLYGDSVCYYMDNHCEVDFYLWEQGEAIQVSYSLADSETLKRETEALLQLNQRFPLARRTIITHNEERVVETPIGDINVIPIWKWLLLN